MGPPNLVSLKIVRVILLLITVCSAVYREGGNDGYFEQNGSCSPGHSSGKLCSNGNEGASCESYMYLNNTTNLCEAGAPDQYYDKIAHICRPCNGSGEGECMAQIQCFQGNYDQVFHLESLRGRENGDESSIHLESSQFTLNSFGRTLEYYVDPDSEEPIELGTRKYPYRSLSLVNSEIINNYSHQDLDVVIFTKSIYIEEDGQRYFNMSSVTIKTHPDLVKLGEKAILTPSSVGKFSISDKAVFHILSHSVADINYVIGSGSFTLTELGIMQIPKVTMMPLRTSLKLENLDLYREEIEPDDSRVFIIPIFLQQKALEIGKDSGLN